MFILFGILFILLFVLMFYIYFSYAWFLIAKKFKYRYPWIAWIPVANIGMILELGDFHWAWTFLILIPILGWIVLFGLLIIAHWKIFEKRKYPGWFSLSLIIHQVGMILYLIAISFLAFKKI